MVVLFGCTSNAQQSVLKIDSDRLLELKDSGVKVVDIRTQKEFDQGHIPDVIHISFNDPDFLTKMSKLNKQEPVIIHCAKGGRSQKAGDLLEQAGFDLIYDYSGGFVDWKSKGLEIEK